MRRLLFLLTLLLLAGCTRGGGAASPTAIPLGTPLGEGIIASVTPPPLTTSGPVTLPGVEQPTSVPIEGLPTAPGALGGRLLNLRFSTTGSGQESTTFPAGTEDIYAIFDYDGMQAGDSVQRVWYRNEVQEIEVTEGWDILKYGFAGTRRDVFHYNYEGSGVYPGNWRVEIYLKGELQVTGTFTVGP